MPTLRELVAQLRIAEIVPRPDNEEWGAMINRISIPGKIAEVHEETYYYFLEVLPPQYQNGNVFAFAEGTEELRVFWRTKGQFFCRQLTMDETVTFCHLANIPLPS
jgi:hypothetical protein